MERRQRQVHIWLPANDLECTDYVVITHVMQICLKSLCTQTTLREHLKLKEYFIQILKCEAKIIITNKNMYLGRIRVEMSLHFCTKP